MADLLLEYVADISFLCGIEVECPDGMRVGVDIKVAWFGEILC